MSEANLHIGAHVSGLMEAPPFAIPSKKLVMWLFIISDAVTFAAVLFAYGYIKNASPNWPEPFKFSPSIINVMLMTFILVSSSLTMLIATRAAKAGDKPRAIRWTFITVAGGVLFALLHIREWMGLIAEGVKLFENPWGSPMFGATFFAITGLHLTHVLGGVIALSVVALGYKRGRYKADDIEIWSLYWHFVDLVWMFVVPMVYLLNVAR
ncbi:MAG TPA: cytochrome c oxidase subunit 3 [Terriglobales bacterium]|nr:cytochrome c oxidase subunit 3 [Terriglobales bacterium]